MTKKTRHLVKHLSDSLRPRSEVRRASDATAHPARAYTLTARTL